MESDPEILRSQYEQSVSLYKHEDTLNWQKVQHAVYVNGALAAVIGVDTIQPIKWIVATLAAAVGLLFLVALENGRRYLITRRETVHKVEEKMGALGGIYPLFNGAHTKSWLPSTMTVMRVFLCLIIVAWTSLAIYWGVTGKPVT